MEVDQICCQSRVKCAESEYQLGIPITFIKTYEIVDFVDHPMTILIKCQTFFVKIRYKFNDLLEVDEIYCQSRVECA